MWQSIGTFQLTDQWYILPELPSPLVRLKHIIVTPASPGFIRFYGFWAQVLPDSNNAPNIIGRWNRLYPDTMDTFLELTRYQDVPYFVALKSFWYNIPNITWSVEASYCTIDINQLNDIQIDIGIIKNTIDLMNNN